MEDHSKEKEERHVNNTAEDTWGDVDTSPTVEEEGDWLTDAHGSSEVDDEEGEVFHPAPEDDDDRRLSSVSCVSSAPPPRDEVLSMLQERTLQALEFQLFDRLNHGDYHEVSHSPILLRDH